MEKIVFWFRRDLRLEDNTGLKNALMQGKEVILLFVFDPLILSELPKNDARVTFIHNQLTKMNGVLKNHGSQIKTVFETPENAFKLLLKDEQITAVYANEDYEPYAIQRDEKVQTLLQNNGVTFHLFTDQVIFHPTKVLKPDQSPYSIYTPYKNKWLSFFDSSMVKETIPTQWAHLSKGNYPVLALSDIGFEKSHITVPPPDLTRVFEYDKIRDSPGQDATTYSGAHLRFGTISIRKLVAYALNQNQTFLNELIWREFFMQIIYHYPRVVNENFKIKYNAVQWINDPNHFKAWCEGKTGYPMVDAGMRQLVQTGFMHNRVRMITAGFLCKHLLTDWRWGEAFFAQHLLDYDLSANNGNWQWAAGTGCDAAPYFRVFNPAEQQKKFDKDFSYIKKWVPEYNTPAYPEPIVNHAFARERAIAAYKKGLANYG